MDDGIRPMRLGHLVLPTQVCEHPRQGNQTGEGGGKYPEPGHLSPPHAALALHANPFSVFKNPQNPTLLIRLHAMLNSEVSPALPRSPPRRSIGSDGSGSPTGLIFSWARLTANEPEKQESDSPPLWRPGASARAPFSSYYPLSGRAQEIARGRQELMDMCAGMPESACELSLKDLVEQKEEAAADEPRTERVPERDSRKRVPQKPKSKKRNNPKGFLLNMFLPGSLTIGPAAGSRAYSPNLPRVSRQNSDKSSKISSQESGKREHHTSSNGNSKISPKPCSPMPDSGKFDQRERPSNCHSGEPTSRSPKRCSMCSEHVIFFKTNCQACGKVFCSSCAKVTIENTPKGRKCQDSCDDQSYRDRNLAPEVNSCWPFPWSYKVKLVKSERKGRNPFSKNVKE